MNHPISMARYLSIIVFVLYMNALFAVDTEMEKLPGRPDQTIPLPYSEQLENYKLTAVDSMALARFKQYDEFFLSTFEAMDLPPTLRYLPFALSGMKSDFQEGDRKGVWALNSLVGVKGGLRINEHLDERFNVYKSTEAAATYLQSLYHLYGDWWKVILAYSNSAISLNKVLPTDTLPLNPWTLYGNPELETTDIIARYIFLASVLNTQTTADYHPPVYSLVDLNREVSREVFLQTLQLSEEDFSKANPVYRGNRLVPVKGYKLRLSESTALQYQELEEDIYQLTLAQDTTFQNAQLAKNSKRKADLDKSIKKNPPHVISYRIRRGDTLGHIARRYGVRVSDLKRWNKLRSDAIREGRILIIRKTR